MEVRFYGTLQYPELFAPKEGNTRCSCMALMEGENAAHVYSKFMEVMAEAFPGVQVPMSFRSGAEKADKPQAGYKPDNYFMNMSSKDPVMCFSQTQQITGPDHPEANLLYPGAVCEFIVDVWAQKPKPGEQRERRINCEIKALQFIQHGPVLDGGSARTKVTAAAFGLPTNNGVDPTGAAAPAPVAAPQLPQVAPQAALPASAPAPSPAPAPVAPPAPQPALPPAPGGMPGMPPLASATPPSSAPAPMPAGMPAPGGMPPPPPPAR